MCLFGTSSVPNNTPAAPQMEGANRKASGYPPTRPPDIEFSSDLQQLVADASSARRNGELG
jgi:hypothetical protein